MLVGSSMVAGVGCGMLGSADSLGLPRGIVLGSGVVAGGSAYIGQAHQWSGLLRGALGERLTCQGYTGYCLWW